MKLGAKGERLAAKHLRRNGYRIISRNYTCPAGEIDLIAADGDTLVFVEVKTRRSDQSADPEANITPHKRRQVIKTARFFATAKSTQERPMRFDVVAVVLPDRGKASVEHFMDAFSA